MKRLKLLLILATMPSEAFGWLLLHIAGSAGSGQVWPDGIGGFTSESQTSIKAAKHEAEAMINAGEEP
jgi:hypothetical protein